MIQINRDEKLLQLYVNVKENPDVFPTSTYFNDLDLYRSISNENIITAKHLVNLPQWIDFEGLLDIGCGDGRMILELFKQYKPESLINEVRMIDLDKNRTERTKVFFSEFQRAKQLSVINSNVINCLSTCFKNIDAALLIHVVYYLNEIELEQIINALPKNVPLFVVVDKEDSIFSKLWKLTAPQYLKRSDYANQYFNQLLTQDDFNVSKTTISSEISDPYTMPLPDKETILSFMCYNEYNKLETETKQKIETIYKEYIKDGKVSIQTNCFCIIKS